MFFDDSLKRLKKELKAAGADMAFVKNWQKSYDKVRKQSIVIEKQYVKDRYVFAEIFDLPELVEDPDMATLPAMTASGKKPGIVRKVEEKMAQKTSD